MQTRRSPRSVKIACNNRGLSHFSGTYFFNEFLRLLHIRNFIAGRIHYPRHCRDYSISQLLLALVYVILLGLDRIETASLLRSEEHTSELQSRLHLVCRLLLEKKKK